MRILMEEELEGKRGFIKGVYFNAEYAKDAEKS